MNARDLETLDVDVERALAICGASPTERLCRDGERDRDPDQVRAAVDAGASAILVGEALMRADDPGAKLRELLGEES